VDERAYPRFRWLERGDGEPVVLLHGLMGEMNHWEATLEALADRYRALAPELPIFDPALAEVSVAALARWVRHLLDALEIPQTVVGGNSLGGHVALSLALDAPERVSGLVLTGSSGLFERGFTRGVPHLPTAQYVRQKMEEVFYEPALVTPDWVESIRRLVTTRRHALRLVQVARAAKRHNLEDRLHEIRVPTLILWGKDDRVTPVEVAEQFHARIPGATLALVTNCGHAPMLERPEAFNAILGQWLADTRARRRQACLGGVR
jgi:pimeloyl-ACP methyl ester carboxylesterase